MAEQLVRPAPAPQLKADSSSLAPQLSAARKVARKGMGDSIAAGGAATGEKLAAGGTDKAEAENAPAKTGTPAAIAQQGFTGTAVELPHLKKMEASFGRSFGHVRAYTDGAARKATDALGAHAYAVGSQIAFNSPNPSEATVAHELTHVVQNNSGVATSGGEDEGIETSGEAEAEGVEAAVAAGKPASSALSSGGGSKAAAGPSLSKKPALESKFAAGVTFSKDALETSGQYELWKANPPIEIPIAAVPGLNAMIEPSVVVKVAAATDFKEQTQSIGLGVEGNVGFGLSYGNAKICSVYGVMEAKASGGFEYKKSSSGWTLDGAIGLSTNFKVGVKVAGGMLDYGYEFGKSEIGKLTMLSWKNGKFNSAGVGWEWGPNPKAFFASVKAAIDKAKKLAAAGAAVAEATYKTGAAVGTGIYNGGAAAIKWVSEW